MVTAYEVQMLITLCTFLQDEVKCEAYKCSCFQNMN